MSVGSHHIFSGLGISIENFEFDWTGLNPVLKADVAELCFNTSQTGYQEILTDPSYAKQIITFTFPHVGICGINNLDIESKKIYASGCILNQNTFHHSSWRSTSELDIFLKENSTPCITNIDTRQLTRILAEKGAIKAAIIHFENQNKNIEILKEKLKNWTGLENLDLASLVSTKESYKLEEGLWNLKNNNYKYKEKSKYNIVCLDFGIKTNILRNLNNNFFNFTVLPANSSLDEILQTNPKGIFLSNGPGDPFATGEYAVPTIQKLIKLKIPIFGICLGHQILSLALGAKTKKMYQGHRGANHPVKNLNNNKVEITSQNHGFEVIRNSLPNHVVETHISLFDNTNEGIRHSNLPIFSVQYHPEASPGPHDSKYLFEEFYNNIKIYAKKK